MIEQPPPGIPLQEPPPPPINQAQGCLRVMLWLMPSGFAAISAWTIDNYNLNVDSLLMLWIGMNLVFWGITGWFNAIMSSPVRALEPGKRTGMIIWLTVAFALLQLVLIPLIAVFLVFAFRAFVAR